MQVGEVYDLHFNESRFGSGHMFIAIMAIGRKWITCVNPATLTTGKVLVVEWNSHKPRLMSLTPTQLASHLAKQSAAYHRMNIKHARKAVKRFNKELRGFGS